jgi:hypothetical protein
VPKSTLVSKLVSVVHGGELFVHEELSDWPVLRRELMNFRPEVTRTGQETWNARSGAHDDLVIATALCSWHLQGGERYSGLVQYYAQQAYGGAGASERWCVGVDVGQSVERDESHRSAEPVGCCSGGLCARNGRRLGGGAGGAAGGTDGSSDGGKPTDPTKPRGPKRKRRRDRDRDFDFDR